MNQYRYTLHTGLLFISLWASSAMAGAITWPAGPGTIHNAGNGIDDAYIIQHQAPPLALYSGGLAGLAATSPQATGAARLDVNSVASVAYLAFLDAEMTVLIAAAETALGRPLELVAQYRYAYSGFAARMSEAEALTVSSLPGVASVQTNFVRKLQTDNGPAWIGAPGIHDGSATVSGIGSLGEGVVVGIIDTGINTDHPSFAATGPVDGYVHVNPRTDPITGQPQYFGLCDPVTGLPWCNSKLIGAWDFTGTTPEDGINHGSHTASTAAGNVLDAVLITPTTNFARRISGVAPHANIIAYKGCQELTGNCIGTSTTSAIDQATADGVDVINYSIGGTSSDPWADADAQAFLGARAAGIFVATSASNDGPKPATIGSPGDAPWLLTVAASTHDRRLSNGITGMVGGATAPPADIFGKSLTGPLGQTAVVYAGDFGDPLCGTPFTGGTFSGQIVVCDRGINARVEKAENAAAGGAGGFVLANDEANGDSTVADAYVIPGVHISFDAGVVLKAWLADGGSGHMATIQGTLAGESPVNADVMAAFSSRGPNPAQAGLIKPDITGPGVDIFAAFNSVAGNPAPSPEYGVISGTSMSSPHLAGAAALIRAVQPDWTPDEVKAALMTTAFNTLGKDPAGSGLVKEDSSTPADPFDVGAGRVNLLQAARAGFVMDVDPAEYTAADPASGGDPLALNIPSIGHGDCISMCSWTRSLTGVRDTTWTVTSTVPAPMTLSVTPASFALAPGGTQELTIDADVRGMSVNQWAFGEIILTPADPTVPTAHFPVAVRIGPIPRIVTVQVDSLSGSAVVEGVVSPNDVTTFTPQISGMLPANRTERLLAQDPTPLDPYDGPHSGPTDPDPATGTFFVLVDVPAGGGRLLDTAITDTLATDLDLYVGRDTNGNGMPDEAEELCAGATATALEKCSLVNPEEGSYWILVQSWLGTGADSVTLDTAVVGQMDEGNLSASAPSPVAAGEPFDVTIAWDEPDFQVGDIWVGLIEMGSGTGQSADVGILVVQLEITDTLPGDGGGTDPEPPVDPAPSTPLQRGSGAADWLLLAGLMSGLLSLRRRSARAAINRC